MVQWVKTLSVKPDNLGSIPEIYVVAGENRVLQTESVR